MYPALAVLQALKNEVYADNSLSVLWVGSEGGMETELVSRAGIPHDQIPAAGLHGVGFRALPGNAVRLIRGYRKAKQILQRFEPDVLFFTGGYIAAPVALAGAHVPTLLFVPDIEPGMALKFLRRFADRVALSVSESEDYFSGQPGRFVSGYPVRADLTVMNKAQARAHFQFEDEKPVLLVMGGSSGARSINQALTGVLGELLQKTNIIHICGKLDWLSISEKHEEMLNHGEIGPLVARSYRVFPYLHEDMGIAYSAADLILCRAGASILGELPLYNLPAILVPYPYAWRYQKLNADYLVTRGAAKLLLDHELSEKIFSTVDHLLSDTETLKSMSQKMHDLGHPDAARKIAETLIQLGSQSSGKRETL